MHGVMHIERDTVQRRSSASQPASPPANAIVSHYGTTVEVSAYHNCQLECSLKVESGLLRTCSIQGLNTTTLVVTPVLQRSVKSCHRIIL
jgi:hypothetical protein